MSISFSFIFFQIYMDVVMREDKWARRLCSVISSSKA